MGSGVNASGGVKWWAKICQRCMESCGFYCFILGKKKKQKPKQKQKKNRLSRKNLKKMKSQRTSETKSI